MSRGPGQLQRAILEHISETTQPLTIESMRWSIYEQQEKPQIPVNGELPNKWNTSFFRAVNNLASESRSLLQIDRRPIASLEECIAFYPGKTLIAPIRRLRIELLPALLEWTQEKHGASPYYTVAEREKFFAEQLPQDRADWLGEEWSRLESLMRPTFSSTGSDELFLLFSKGRSLFRGIDVTSRLSFTEMVQRCCAAGILHRTVADRLRSFADEFISPAIANSLTLKSFVHKFANVPRWGQCSLRTDTLEALHRLRKPFVETMPGFRPAADSWMREPTYSNALHKLFDQTVFQKFNFVRPAA
jgi:hypothetical protein